MAEAENIDDMRIHIATAIGISLAILVYIYFPAHSRLNEVRTELQGISMEAERTAEDVLEFRAEKKAIEEDPLYLEKVIRMELRMVKPGEIPNEYKK